MFLIIIFLICCLFSSCSKPPMCCPFLPHSMSFNPSKALLTSSELPIPWNAHINVIGAFARSRKQLYDVTAFTSPQPPLRWFINRGRVRAHSLLVGSLWWDEDPSATDPISSLTDFSALIISTAGLPPTSEEGSGGGGISPGFPHRLPRSRDWTKLTTNNGKAQQPQDLSLISCSEQPFQKLCEKSSRLPIGEGVCRSGMLAATTEKSKT